ncbi:MAG: hypothetical protein AMXMBFR56_56920 [Polyangiaceae bacterium]
MARSTGSDILEAGLLNVTTRVDAADQWEIFECTSRDAFAQARYVVLFGSAATWTAAEECAKRVKELGNRKKQEVHAIVWPSCVLAQDKKRVQGLVGGPCRDVQTFHAQAAAVTLNIRDEAALAPRTFVEPTIALEEHESSGAFRFLDDWLYSSDAQGRRLLVLIAPAAVGKTTLARALRDRLVDKTPSKRTPRRPLLLESSTWGPLRLDQLAFEDLWLRALSDNYRTAMSVEVFSAFVESGTVVPIFDGFDELCSRAGDDFSPIATVENLLELSSSEEARVILTTRQTYWAGTVAEHVAKLPGVRQVHLQPFDGNQISQFVERRFPGPALAGRRDDTLRLLDRLRTQTEQKDPAERIASLPLTVELVCDALGDDGKSALTADGLAGDPLNSLITLACDRERERRGLELSNEQQRVLFRELAAYRPRLFSRVELDETLSTFFEGLSARQRGIVPDHQLLRLEGTNLSFRYEFVRNFLRAQVLREALEAPDANRQTLVQVLQEEADGQGPTLDHWEELDRGSARLADAWKVLRRLRQEDPKDRARALAQSAALQIFVRIARADHPIGTSERQAATAAVVANLGEAFLSDAFVVGSISDLDLRGKTFTRCVFDNSGFFRCDLDATVRFDSCRFEGSFDISLCSGGEHVEWPSGAGVSLQAQRSFVGQLGIRRAQALPESAIAEVVHQILGRFRRGAAFRAIQVDNVLTGTLRNSELARDAFAELEQAVIEIHAISGLGPKEGRNVKKECIEEVRRFLDNRLLGGALLEVVRRIETKWGG